METTEWKCRDGVVTKLSQPSKNLLCWAGQKPREMTPCKVQFVQLLLKSPATINSSDSGDDCTKTRFHSTYLQNCCDNPTAVETIDNIVEFSNPKDVQLTIGISCITKWDRLIDFCLTKMVSEETATFSLSTDDTTVEITLKLIAFEEVIELYNLSAASLLEIASQLKIQGVQLFSQGKTQHAFHKFQKAIQYLIIMNDEEECSEEVLSNRGELLVTLYCNMAGIHVQEKNWEHCIDLCTTVLSSKPNYIKALFRRGKSLMEIQEYDRSAIDLHKAKSLDPKNQAVLSTIIELNKRVKLVNKHYANAMKKMFT